MAGTKSKYMTGARQRAALGSLPDVQRGALCICCPGLPLCVRDRHSTAWHASHGEVAERSIGIGLHSTVKVDSFRAQVPGSSGPSSMDIAVSIA